MIGVDAHGEFTDGTYWNRETPAAGPRRGTGTGEEGSPQLTIRWIMFAEPEAGGHSERRTSERPPRQEAEGAWPQAGGEGTLRRGAEHT
jgi:hypothetical protein